MSAGIPGKRQHPAEFKAKVALVAIKGEKTIAEISSLYGIHSSVIAKWKKQALEQLPHVFSVKPDSQAKAKEELTASLYQEIGQLKVELDWLKKKAALWS